MDFKPIAIGAGAFAVAFAGFFVFMNMTPTRSTRPKCEDGTATVANIAHQKLSSSYRRHRAYDGNACPFFRLISAEIVTIPHVDKAGVAHAVHCGEEFRECPMVSASHMLIREPLGPVS